MGLTQTDIATNKSLVHPIGQAHSLPSRLLAADSPEVLLIVACHASLVCIRGLKASSWVARMAFVTGSRLQCGQAQTEKKGVLGWLHEGRKRKQELPNPVC